MKTYTVKQIAEMFSTNPEPVRCWIRSGKLKATQESRRESNVVTKQMLDAFIKATPKYAETVTTKAGLSAAIIATAVALLDGVVVQQYEKSKALEEARVSTSEIEKLLNENIKARNAAIDRKMQAVTQLQQEIENNRRNIQASEHLINKLQNNSDADEGGDTI